MRIAFRIIVLTLFLQLFSHSVLLADAAILIAGDRVDIVVDDEKDLTKTYQIDKDGYITIASNYKVKISGLSTSDSSGVIAKALSNIMVAPQVTVTFAGREKLPIFVVGSVKTPGLVNIESGDRVIQALAQAGYDSNADLAHISLRRGSEIINLDLTKYLKGEDLNVNVELQSGDTVVVPQTNMAGTVQVLGQAVRVGQIPLKQGMTFRETMGLIGGVTVEADTTGITIKREGLAEPIRVDYEHAMQGDSTADILMQPGDTIYIPQTDKSFFTVIGAVHKPGQFPLKGKIKISEAIGLAGGAIPNQSDTKQITITRKDDSKKSSQTIKVNLNNVLLKAAEEPLVQCGDVVYVKESKEKPTALQLLQSILPLALIFGR